MKPTDPAEAPLYVQSGITSMFQLDKLLRCEAQWRSCGRPWAIHGVFSGSAKNQIGTPQGAITGRPIDVRADTEVLIIPVQDVAKVDEVECLPNLWLHHSLLILSAISCQVVTP